MDVPILLIYVREDLPNEVAVCSWNPAQQRLQLSSLYYRRRCGDMIMNYNHYTQCPCQHINPESLFQLSTVTST